MKKGVFLFFMLGILIPHLYSQSLYRGSYWEIGGSYSWASYTKDIDLLIDLADANRKTFSIGGSLGLEYTRKYYFVVTGSCLIDLFQHSGSSINIFFPFAGFGVRRYPFYDFIQFGVDVGLTWMQVNTRINNTTASEKSFGPGIKASIAIDLEVIPILIGCEFSISKIESEYPNNLGVFIKFTDKY